MSPDSRRRLEAFVALVEKIEGYPYFKRGEKIAGGKIRMENGRLAIEFHGPPDHETDAVALKVRLLTHSDDVSMRRMGELFVDPEISAEWREGYERWAGALRFRMQETWAEGPKGTLTFRDAFEMELHGHRGHYKASDEAYKNYQKWVTDDFERQDVEDTFHQVLIWVVASAHNLAAASRRELARDERNQIAQST